MSAKSCQALGFMAPWNPHCLLGQLAQLTPSLVTGLEATILAVLYFQTPQSVKAILVYFSACYWKINLFTIISSILV